MPVYVIREGLPAMLADDLFTCSAGSGFVMHQPEFISTGIRTEAARPELTGYDGLSALRAYRPRAFRDRTTDGIPVEIVLDYIHNTNNYFKHSCNLFGSYSSQELFYKKDKNITIPLFYYKEKDYPSKKIKDLFAYYETIIGIYIDILDSIDLYLKNIPPINNRYYVAGYIIDGITTREARLTNELVLHVNRIDEKTKYWIDNYSFEEGKLIEIMEYYDMSVGQHYEWIKEIDVFQDNKKVGVLKSIEHKIDWSILTYRKYKYHAEK